MPDINEFYANFGKGARANKYRVELVYPGVAQAGGASMEFYAKAAQIPASTVGVIEIPYMGRMFKVAGDRTFAEWTITIMNDESFKHRNAMERWSNAINAHEGNGMVNDSYFARAIFYQLDATVQGNVLKQYTFENLWPSEVGAIEVGYDNNDSIQEFTVTFQYSHWTATTTS